MYKIFAMTSMVSATAVDFTGAAGDATTLVYDQFTEVNVDDMDTELTGLVEATNDDDTGASVVLSFTETEILGLQLKAIRTFDMETFGYLEDFSGTEIYLGDSDTPCNTVPDIIGDQFQDVTLWYNVYEGCTGTVSSVTLKRPGGALSFEGVILHDTELPEAYTYLFSSPYATVPLVSVPCGTDLEASYDSDAVAVKFDFVEDGSNLFIRQTCPDAEDLYLTEYATTMSATSDDEISLEFVKTNDADFYTFSKTSDFFTEIHNIYAGDFIPTEAQREALYGDLDDMTVTEGECLLLTDIDFVKVDAVFETGMAASQDDCDKLAYAMGYPYSGHSLFMTVFGVDLFFCFAFSEEPDLEAFTEEGAADQTLSNCVQVNGNGWTEPVEEEEEEEEDEDDETSATKIAAAASMILASAALL